MTPGGTIATRLLPAVLAMAVAALPACAQRHSGITSPPTAPPTVQAAPPTPTPLVPLSSGLGPLVFAEANASEPAPESLARQLQADDERIRAAALAAMGAPAAYLVHDNAPKPHSVRVDYVALSNTGEMDAILTAELDLHLVSAILVPSGAGWRRVATVTYATTFADPSTSPGTFLRTARSLMGLDHYSAVYRGTSLTPNGDMTEHQAYLNVFNGHAAITMSFVSRQRICEAAHLEAHTPHGQCELTDRWIQPDPVDDSTHILLVSATGRVDAHEAVDPLSIARVFDFAKTREYMCQPFAFSDESSHYEPTAAAAACVQH